MEKYLYSDLMGINYDDLKQTLTQVNLSHDDQQAYPMSDSGFYPLEGANTGGNISDNSNTMELNTAMMDFMCLDDTREAGKQQIDLPQDMADMVANVFAEQQNFPLALDDDAHTHLDVNAASLWADEDSLDLDSINPNTLFSYDENMVQQQQQPLYQPLESQAVAYQASSVPDTARMTRGRKKAKKQLRATDVTYDSVAAQCQTAMPPSLEELRVPVPSPYSDTESSTDEGSRSRQRRSRVSYATLTEEQKYQRIRELNNEASRLYRQRHRQTQSQREDEQRTLEEKNRMLRAKAERLEQLKNEIQRYVQNVFQQQLQH